MMIVENRVNNKEGSLVPSMTLGYYEQLSGIIEDGNKLKEEALEKESQLKEKYPKMNMLLKVSRIVKDKEGLSEFETYYG